MTQEEKAKAYDEAKKKMHEIITMDDNPVRPTEIAKYLFPELAESEDERIINAIIGIIKTDYIVDINVSQEKMLAWLEKQKEHQFCSDAPTKKSVGGNFSSSHKDKNLDEIAQDYVDGVKQYNPEPTWDLMQTAVCYGANWRKEQFEKNRLANCDALSKEECDRETDFAMEIIEKEHRQPTFNDAINYGMRLQKEQKPVEPSDDELQRHQDELYDFKVFAAKQAKEHHISFVHDFEWNNFCAEILSYFNEQKPAGFYVTLNGEKYYAEEVRCDGMNVKVVAPKPAEWSEEDNEMLKDTIRAFYLAYPYALDDENPRKKNIDWLNFLPERFNLYPKQGWGEEDENAIATAIRACRYMTENFENSTKQYEDAIKRLKSLRPQPREEIYQSAKHDLAIKFMNYLDENRPDEKMGLSNGECEDIDKAFKENDWAKIMRYVEKYRPSWKPSKDEERLINTSISFLKDFADKGYENAVECIDWLKSKLNGNSCK